MESEKYLHFEARNRPGGGKTCPGAMPWLQIR